MKIIFPTSLAVLMVLTPIAAKAEPKNAAIAAHANDLVKLEGEHLVPFPSTQFPNAVYTVIFFSAGWCPDCRRFSPSLVEAYNQQPKGGDRFEVLLFSMDKSAEGMRKYMRTEKMNWPAIAFDKIRTAEDLKEYYSGHGIPCLSVIDSKGTLVLQSKSDQDAQEVLKELQDLMRHHDLKVR